MCGCQQDLGTIEREGRGGEGKTSLSVQDSCRIGLLEEGFVSFIFPEKIQRLKLPPWHYRIDYNGIALALVR